jgi:hypothetical protein
MSEDHKRGDRIENFCTLPARPPCKTPEPCPHSKDYREACKPKPEWQRPKFRRLIKYTSKPWKTQNYPYEAHHLLCVGSVTDHILGDAKIRSIIEQTTWCINGEINMKAMPLWGHTIQHYCDLEDVKYTYKVKDSRVGPWAQVIEPTQVRFLENAAKPDFADIPMHNFGHNSKKGYKYEVDVRLQNVAGKIARAQKNHEEKIEELKERLDTLSQQFKKKLEERGIRKVGTHGARGTHEGWQIGLKERKPSTGWYKPFSMEIKPKPMTFPMKEGLAGEMGEKIKKLVQAYHY